MVWSIGPGDATHVGGNAREPGCDPVHVSPADLVGVGPEDDGTASHLREGSMSWRGGGASHGTDRGYAEVPQGHGGLLAFTNDDDGAPVELLDPVQGEIGKRETPKPLFTVGLLPPHLLSVSVVDTAVGSHKVT